jgi:hypothetical protein
LPSVRIASRKGGFGFANPEMEPPERLKGYSVNQLSISLTVSAGISSVSHALPYA